MKKENSEWLEAFLMLLISIPILIGVALPLRFFEQKFCESWGNEQGIKTRDKTFSLMGCEYYDQTLNSWAPFTAYFPNLETQKATKEKKQKDLNREFFDTHPDLETPSY